MGIKGLLWYTRTQTNACYDVDIRELSAEKKREGKDPVVLIDVMNCNRYIYKDLDWMCGGQYKEYLERWQQFLDSFKNAGIRLIMIMDGTCQESKRTTWIRRRYDKLGETIYPVFDFLKNRNNIRLPEKLDSALPNLNTKYLLTHILGVEVITSLQEADYEIAKAAKDYDAIGILANDSDFLIYQTGVPMLSITDLDITSLRTKVFDPRRLASSLQLETSQLPLLAILTGNDTVEKDRLREFHSRLVGHYKRNDVSVLLPALARFIKDQRLGRGGYTGADIINNLGEIAKNVFRDESITELLEETIRDYFLDLPVPTEMPPGYKDANWRQIIENTQADYVSSRGGNLFSIMILQKYESSGSLEDYRESHLIPPVGLLWESTRHRIYGILLKEHPENTDKSMTVEELVMTGYESLDSPSYVSPEYPPEHPGLLYLRSDRSVAAKITRYKLFAWAVSPSLSHQTLMELEPAEVGVVAMLYKIQHERDRKILQKWEVNVFLVQFFVLKELTAQDIQDMPSMVPTARSAHLATLFKNSTLLQLNWAVGELLPTESLLPYSQFDGKLFQTLYGRGQSYTVSDILQKCSTKFRRSFQSVEDRIERLSNIVNES